MTVAARYWAPAAWIAGGWQKSVLLEIGADGRFKGGYITRHYGRPDDDIHAVQLEMIWDCYMDETPPYAYRPDKAAQVQPLLRELLRTMRDWKPA